MNYKSIIVALTVFITCVSVEIEATGNGILNLATEEMKFSVNRHLRLFQHQKTDDDYSYDDEDEDDDDEDEDDSSDAQSGTDPVTIESCVPISQCQMCHGGKRSGHTGCSATGKRIQMKCNVAERNKKQVTTYVSCSRTPMDEDYLMVSEVRPFSYKLIGSYYIVSFLHTIQHKSNQIINLSNNFCTKTLISMQLDSIPRFMSFYRIFLFKSGTERKNYQCLLIRYTVTSKNTAGNGTTYWY